LPRGSRVGSQSLPTKRGRLDGSGHAPGGRPATVATSDSPGLGLGIYLPEGWRSSPAERMTSSQVSGSRGRTSSSAAATCWVVVGTDDGMRGVAEMLARASRTPQGTSATCWLSSAQSCWALAVLAPPAIRAGVSPSLSTWSWGTQERMSVPPRWGVPCKPATRNPLHGEFGGPADAVVPVGDLVGGRQREPDLLGGERAQQRGGDRVIHGGRDHRPAGQPVSARGCFSTSSRTAVTRAFRSTPTR